MEGVASTVINTAVTYSLLTTFLIMSSLFKLTTTYAPIFSLLNAETEERRDELTTKWKDNKLAELNFIGIVVS